MEIYGVDVYNIIMFALVVLIGIIIGMIANMVIKRLLKKIVAKTKTKRDDELLEHLDLPISVIIITVFFYIGLKFLPLPAEVFQLVDEAVKVIAILIITYFIIKVVDYLIDRYAILLCKKAELEIKEHILKPVKKIINLTLTILGILTALSAVGYDITALLAGLGIGGLAVALASQETIKNFIAGFLIFTDRPFSLGDWIKVNDIEGIVEDIGVRSTKIRTFDYSLVTIPNSTLLESAIENFTVRDRRRVLTTLGLTYDTPVEKIKRAKEIIIKILEEHPATLPPYRIHFMEYADWSLNLRLEYFVRNIGFDYFLNAVDDINLKIKEEFEKEGINFAFPTYTLYLENTNNLNPTTKK